VARGAFFESRDKGERDSAGVFRQRPEQGVIIRQRRQSDGARAQDFSRDADGAFRRAERADRGAALAVLRRGVGVCQRRGRADRRGIQRVQRGVSAMQGFA